MESLKNIKRSRLFSMLNFFARLNIKFSLLLIIISCVSYHKTTQGSMTLIFGTDSISVTKMKYLEAVYTTDADLGATADGYLNIIRGAKYVFVLHSDHPQTTMRIVPPKILVGYLLLIVLDSSALNETVKLKSTKTLFHHEEFHNYNLIINEIGSPLQGEFIIYRQTADTIFGYISFNGMVRDINPQKYNKYRTSRQVEGQVYFKASKTDLRTVSSYLKRLALPKEFLLEFLKN